MARQEKNRVIVVKVIPAFEGHLNLAGIKNIEKVLGVRVSKVVSQVEASAKTQGALVKTRIHPGKVPDAIVEVAQMESDASGS